MSKSSAPRSPTPDKQGFIDAMAPVYEKHVKDDVLKKMVEDVKAVQ